jgi:hypothetical protein
MLLTAQDRLATCRRKSENMHKREQKKVLHCEPGFVKYTHFEEKWIEWETYLIFLLPEVGQATVYNYLTIP